MFTFDEATHTYALDGTILPSVSQLLSGCGIINTSFFKPEHAEAGTRRHLITEYYDKGTLDWGTVGEADLPYLEAWIKAREELGFNIVEIEQRMYHPQYGYAGTIDRITEINDAPWIIDIKTGQKQRWHELQVVLYGLMLSHDGVHPNLMDIYIKKNGKYSTEVFGYDKKNTALAALRVYQFKEKRT